MKPISPFGFGLMLFARFVSRKIINFIIFDQLKEPVAGGNIFSLKNLLVKLQPKLAPPPPNQKSWLRP